MSRRLAMRLLTAALLAAAGCYQDEPGSIGPGNRKPVARVLLTDAPFPYDSLHGVTIYVVRIEASTAQDSSGGDLWAVIKIGRASCRERV